MSNDPYAAGSQPPEYDPAEPMPDNLAAIKGRVLAPAICLIVLGILNLFWALYMAFTAIIWTVMPPEQMMAQYEAFGLTAATAGKTPDQMRVQGMVVSWPWALLSFIASVLPVVGGIRMLSLKSHALAVCGAISAALPCVSVFACCGVGEGIGIWALVVLLSEEVRAAFR